LLYGMRRQGVGFLIVALVVATSRVYIGTHYASDTLGRAFTGVPAAMLVRVLYCEGSRTDQFITGIL